MQLIHTELDDNSVLFRIQKFPLVWQRPIFADLINIEWEHRLSGYYRLISIGRDMLRAVYCRLWCVCFMATSGSSTVIPRPLYTVIICEENMFGKPLVNEQPFIFRPLLLTEVRSYIFILVHFCPLERNAACTKS